MFPIVIDISRLYYTLTWRVLSMTNEQLAQFIQRGGNDEFLPLLWDKTRHLIYQKCGRLWQFYSEKLKRFGYSFEDLYQESYNALLFAVGQFKSEKGYKFTTYLNYALKHVIRALLSGGCDVLNMSNTQSLESPIGTNENGDAQLLCDVLEDENAGNAFEEIEQRFEYTALYKAIEQLPKDERKIIIEHYFRNMSFAEIGKLYGIPAARVYQKHNAALDMLKYGKEGEFLRKFYNDGAALPKREKPSGIKRKGLAAFKRSGTSEIEDYVVWLLSHSK